MRKSAIVVVAVILLTYCAVAARGQEEQSGLIKSANGVFVVWNEPGNYYTVEIKGNRITPADQPKLFQVDGKFFQIQTTEKKQFLKDSNAKAIDDKAVLTAHRDWERDYAANLLKLELKVDSEWVKLSGNRDALMWSFDMPKVADSDIQSARRQLFLTVVKRDHVFVLSSAITDLADTRDAKALLMESMQTMRSRDKALSLQKASEQMRKQN